MGPSGQREYLEGVVTAEVEMDFDDAYTQSGDPNSDIYEASQSSVDFVNSVG
jgi:hypothetical protein